LRIARNDEEKRSSKDKETIPKRKKGRLNDKRPKSREETPKEGSDSARRYRTATICDRAAQNARTFKSFPMQNSQPLQAGNTSAVVNNFLN
jgi:hypothetical protein